jgi:hypothetical protein
MLPQGRKERKPLAMTHTGSPSKDSWEGVPSALLDGSPWFVAVDLNMLNSPSSSGERDINVKRALEGLQGKFATLSEHLTSQSSHLSENFDEISNRLNSFGLNRSSLDRRIGEPHRFGADGAVTSAFNGLSFIHEELKAAMEPFHKNPYRTVVAAVNKTQSNLSLLNSVGNHEEIMEVKQALMEVVEANQRTTVQNFETLNTRFVGPVSAFYAEAMKAGGTVFNRLSAVKEAVKGRSEDRKIFGAISYLGGFD